MKKFLILILPIFVLAGCLSNGYRNGDIDWIAMGPEFQKTRVDDVEVITERRHITEVFTHIGLLRIKNVSADYASRDKAVMKARKYAADKGASAILIREVYVRRDEGGSDGIVLSVYVIKYRSDLQSEDRIRLGEEEEVEENVKENVEEKVEENIKENVQAEK